MDEARFLLQPGRELLRIQVLPFARVGLRSVRHGVVYHTVDQQADLGRALFAQVHRNLQIGLARFRLLVGQLEQNRLEATRAGVRVRRAPTGFPSAVEPLVQARRNVIHRI